VSEILHVDKPEAKEVPMMWACEKCGGSFHVSLTECPDCNPRDEPTYAMQFAMSAIARLEKISDNDTQIVDALTMVLEWTKNKLKKIGGC
jgi:hypothetical protein